MQSGDQADRLFVLGLDIGRSGGEKVIRLVLDSGTADAAVLAQARPAQVQARHVGAALGCQDVDEPLFRPRRRAGLHTGLQHGELLQPLLGHRRQAVPCAGLALFQAMQQHGDDVLAGAPHRTAAIAVEPDTVAAGFDEDFLLVHIAVAALDLARDHAVEEVDIDNHALAGIALATREGGRVELADNVLEGVMHGKSADNA